MPFGGGALPDAGGGTASAIEHRVGNQGRPQGGECARFRVVERRDGDSLDTNKPEAERTFESLNPVNGERHAVLNMAAAVASLKKMNPDAGVEKTLEWPESFDDAGKQALYEIKGDVYVLNLARSTFTRITNTPAEEKDAQFLLMAGSSRSCVTTISMCTISRREKRHG